ncbi:LCP family protein [Streptomyces sp. NPDC052236]|uniref:LCP family protein n=1 Tax=Streptomyces sp. NPDC052236 TaxID=3365686 RepID=UPI0037CCF5A9
MNDQQNPYDPYYQQPQIIGYDEYGQPVYQQPQQYDPYAQQQTQYPEQPQQSQQQPQAPEQGQAQGYGYDPYAQQQGQGYGYDAYGYDTDRQPAAVDIELQQPQQPHQAQQTQQAQQAQQWSIPRQQAPAEDLVQAPAPGPTAVPEQHEQREQRAPEPDGDYRTEQFSFIEEPDQDSQDVIDWLKFTESRSERREVAKRRGRNRVVALVVVLALAVVGGVGYLWYAGQLPGLADAEQKTTTATGPQKRDVIVVHLHNTKKKGTSTALLVDNVTTKQGTTVLLPNTLSVANDDGTATTLAKSVEDDGSAGTREAVGTLLGAKITGTWRLDTPYLENLVEQVGNIDLTTDTDVPAAEKGAAPLVQKGENQTLNGRSAVAYATYLGPGEAEAKQLQRFGQVMQSILKKFPADPKAATVTVETLAQILDPSLRESDLGASLAKLGERAKGGDYTTAVLPVQQDGTLTEQAVNSVVKDLLGGSVTAPEKDAAVRVGVKNATGNADVTEAARVALVNGGYSVIDSGKADTESSSQVTYGDETQQAMAVEVAKTLGLPTSAVKKGKAAANADVSVLLGKDYKIDQSE